jgi:hypothetical protein
MKQITLNVPDDLGDLWEREPERFQRAVLAALGREREKDDVAERLELVRTVTRCKARVWNWGDLEREILEGAV